MKSKVLTLAAFVLLMGTLVSCGNIGNTTAASGTSGTEAETSASTKKTVATTAPFVIPEHTDGLKFTYSSNNKQYSVYQYSGSEKEVIIPSMYDDGKNGPAPVVMVHAGIFRSKGIKSIVLSENITVIGKEAFMRCSDLESITLYPGITSIGDYAFEMCSKLKDITIPSGVTAIGNRAFGSCSSIESIVIPQTTKTIDSFAFNGCTSLKTITILSEDLSIGLAAFSSVPDQTQVNFCGTEEQWNAIVGTTVIFPKDITINYNFNYVPEA